MVHTGTGMTMAEAAGAAGPAMTHYDAVIAGCGPVGAALANLLAAQGLTVCIAEKHKAVYDKPRAITFDWEGMRVLQFCGVAEEFSKGIRPHPGTGFRGLDGQIIKLFDPLPPPWDLGWPPTFTFVQPEMERLLREALVRRETVTLLLGHSVEGFRDEGDRVCVDILDLDTGGTRTVTGDFLIGCDGANSGVRAGARPAAGGSGLRRELAGGRCAAAARDRDPGQGHAILLAVAAGELSFPGRASCAAGSSRSCRARRRWSSTTRRGCARCSPTMSIPAPWRSGAARPTASPPGSAQNGARGGCCWPATPSTRRRPSSARA